MTSKYVLDSYAWVEYFGGTHKGKKVKELLESRTCFTPSIVIAELSNKYERENKDWGICSSFIQLNSEIISLDFPIAEKSGKIKQIIRKKYKSKFGLADAIILATAREFNAKVVTGDQHFKHLKNTEFLG
jgi:predicted nucleic acid-binding protein